MAPSPAAAAFPPPLSACPPPSADGLVAGQAILGRYFGGTVAPLGLALGALVPTLFAILAFRIL